MRLFAELVLPRFLSCCSKLLCTDCGWKYAAHEAARSRDFEVRCPLCRTIVPWNNEETLALMERNASRGDLAATCQLGLYYRDGKMGCAVDLCRAAQYYRRAADAGHLGAMVDLGVCYEGGRGVARDVERAAEWYEKAARGGHARATFNLGFFYAMGYGGLAKDPQEAARLYKLAANRGDVKAQNNLALAFVNGTTPGIPKDLKAAERFFALASAQGDALATKNLAALRRSLHGSGGNPT